MKRARKPLTVLGLGMLCLGAAIAVALVIFPGGPDGLRSDQSPESGASSRWPSQTLVDWAGFADQLSVVTVVDERDLPPVPGQDPSADDGYVGREVSLRVERTLWRRPGAPTVAAEESIIRIVALGSARDERGEQTPFATLDAARLEVGQRYLIPLLRAAGADDEGGRASDSEWAVLAQSAILTLDGDTVTSRVEGGTPSPAAQALDGESVERAGEIVARTSPTPAAERNAELPPDARSDAVQRAGE